MSDYMSDDKGLGGPLRNQDLEPARVVSAAEWGTLGPNPEGGAWLVVMDDEGRPLVATSPEDEQAPLLIVADAALPVATAVDSEAFADAKSDTAVVVVDQSLRVDPQVLGVWTGQSLISTLARYYPPRNPPRGMPRVPRHSGGVSFSLPDFPSIPYISRLCGYAGSGINCDTLVTFPRKPSKMPSCDNAKRLTPHFFVW